MAEAYGRLGGPGRVGWAAAAENLSGREGGTYEVLRGDVGERTVRGRRGTTSLIGLVGAEIGSEIN